MGLFPRCRAALGSGFQGHCRPWLTRGWRGAELPFRSYKHKQSAIKSTCQQDPRPSQEHRSCSTASNYVDAGFTFVVTLRTFNRDRERPMIAITHLVFVTSKIKQCFPNKATQHTTSRLQINMHMGIRDSSALKLEMLNIWRITHIYTQIVWYYIISYLHTSFNTFTFP